MSDLPPLIPELLLLGFEHETALEPKAGGYHFYVYQRGGHSFEICDNRSYKTTEYPRPFNIYVDSERVHSLPQTVDEVIAWAVSELEKCT